MKKELKHADIIAKLSARQKADLMTGRDFWSTLNIDELGIPSGKDCVFIAVCPVPPTTCDGAKQ